MQKALAIAAIAASLGLASLPANAMGSLANRHAAPVSAKVQTLASQDQQAGQSNDGKKCWYVLDVLLCE